MKQHDQKKVPNLGGKKKE